MSKKVCIYLIGHSPDAKYATQLLDSIRPAIDAVFYLNTDTKQDTTNAIQGWCANNHIPFKKGERIVEKNDFHFGNTRQASLDMAQEQFKNCDWFMWLDLDDEVKNADQIKSLLDNEDIDCWHFPYEVDGAGRFTRERLARRNQGKWVNRVHEIFKRKEGTREKCCNDIVVIHKKEIGDGTGSHDFHIELMKKEIENAPNYYLYIGKEFFNSKRPIEAKQYFEIGAKMTECRLERYNAYIVLAKIAGFQVDERTQKEYLNKAIDTDPTRREAFYYFAVLETEKRQFERALAMIRFCCALPKPDLSMLEREVYETYLPQLLFYRLLARLYRYHEAMSVASAIIQNFKDLDSEFLREAKVLQILTAKDEE
jgi:hypothetical protein